MAARAQRQDGYDSYGEGDSYGEEARGEEGLSKEQYVAEQRLLRGSAAHSFEGSEHSEEEDAMPDFENDCPLADDDAMECAVTSPRYHGGGAEFGAEF